MVQTTRYKINKLNKSQGCNAQHRKYSQHFAITLYSILEKGMATYCSILAW